LRVTNTPPEHDFTASLAEQLAALNPASLGQADRAQIKRLILDHVGVCRRGAELPWSLALRPMGQKF
jgi:hypothetical protein